MINLLSDESKKDIRAAKSNAILLNYMLVLGFGVLFLGFICAGVYIILTNTQASAEKLISDNTAKDSSQGLVQAQSTALRTSLSTAKSIFDQEIVYSKFITNLTELMPKGVVLNTLSISAATFGTPTTLQFFAKTTEDALALKSKLEASPYFSGISFQSLSSNNSGQSTAYPVSATVGLTINKSIAQ